jgi:hypothetical protein
MAIVLLLVQRAELLHAASEATEFCRTNEASPEQK